MPDSVQPHRRQPTRLPRPWDSPGKNTGVGCHCLLQCMKVKSESELAQSCPTLHDPMDWSPPGSPIPGILQARVLQWGAISFSNAWEWKVKVKALSCVWPSATPWTAAHQAPPSMRSSRQEYWSGVPLPSPLCEKEFSKGIWVQEFLDDRNKIKPKEERVFFTNLKTFYNRRLFKAGNVRCYFSHSD